MKPTRLLQSTAARDALAQRYAAWLDLRAKVDELTAAMSRAHDQAQENSDMCDDCAEVAAVLRRALDEEGAGT